MLRNFLQRLHILPQLPDINPMEHLWVELERCVSRKLVSNKEELNTHIADESKNIPKEFTKTLNFKYA